MILDNLRAHKREATRAIIEGAGCLLIFLPPYSPGCSSIELAFSTIKERLRRAKSRTRETLEAAISRALAAVTARDVTGWFRHCGYCNLGLSSCDPL